MVLKRDLLWLCQGSWERGDHITLIKSFNIPLRASFCESHLGHLLSCKETGISYEIIQQGPAWPGENEHPKKMIQWGYMWAPQNEKASDDRVTGNLRIFYPNLCRPKLRVSSFVCSNDTSNHFPFHGRLLFSLWIFFLLPSIQGILSAHPPALPVSWVANLYLPIRCWTKIFSNWCRSHTHVQVRTRGHPRPLPGQPQRHKAALSNLLVNDGSQYYLHHFCQPLWLEEWK